MKSIVQAVIILALSLLIVGATYGVSQSGWATSQSFGRRPPSEERGQIDRPPAANNERANQPPQERRRPGGHHHHDRPLGLASLGSFVRILLPMALVIGGVQVVRRRGWAKRRTI